MKMVSSESVEEERWCRSWRAEWSFGVSLFRHEGGVFLASTISQELRARVPRSQSQSKGCGSSAKNLEVIVNLLSEAKLSLMVSRGFLLVLVPSVDGKCGLL